MSSLIAWVGRYGKRFLALGIILGLFFLARLPVLSATEKESMVKRFHFTRFTLPELTGYPSQNLRTVHPSLERHAAWISAVGAAIALNDLDGDGLANDACLA